MKKSYMYAGISIFIWSTISIISKLLLYNYSKFFVLCVSCLFATASLLVLNLITGNMRKLKDIKPKDYLIITLVGLPGTFLYQLFFYAGSDIIPSTGQSFTINYLWPAMGVVFGCIILKDKLTARKAIAIIMSFLGVVAVSADDLLHFNKNLLIGALCCILGAVFYGLFTALTQLVSYDKKISSMIYYFNSFILTGIIVLIEGEKISVTPSSVLGFAYNGIFCLAVGTTCWALALGTEKGGKTAKIANLAYITPVASMLWSSLIPESILPDNDLKPQYVVGLCLILVGILIQLKDKKK